MQKMRSYYWKIAKIAQRWLPDPQPPAVGDFASRPPMVPGGLGDPLSATLPLRIPGYATGLRPNELEERGLRQGEHFADKEREIFFSCFARTFIMAGRPLFTSLVTV